MHIEILASLDNLNGLNLAHFMLYAPTSHWTTIKLHKKFANANANNNNNNNVFYTNMLRASPSPSHVCMSMGRGQEVHQIH